MNKYFGEVVHYKEHEAEEAKKYLELWKKFLVRRLKRDSYDVKIIDEQWVERPPEYSGCLCNTFSMALKLAVEADWHYELGKS
jgi:hypothetical protein